jgi:hypothetical protein
MRELGFLPAVGPNLPHAPVNLSEKTGGILNELEKAHLYIEELSLRIKDIGARLADSGK